MTGHWLTLLAMTTLNSPFLKGMAFCLLCNYGVLVFNSPFLKGVAFLPFFERQK